jgi:hypothetical protein
LSPEKLRKREEGRGKKEEGRRKFVGWVEHSETQHIGT